MMIGWTKFFLLFAFSSLGFCEDASRNEMDFYIVRVQKGKEGEEMKRYISQLSTDVGFDLFFEGVELNDTLSTPGAVQLLRLGFTNHDDLKVSERSVHGFVNGKFYSQEVSDKAFFLITNREVLLDLHSDIPLDLQKKELQRYLLKVSEKSVPTVFLK